MKSNKVLTWALTIARITIGWYFLYEGVHKLIAPQWSAKIFLLESRWIFSGFFHQLAENPDSLEEPWIAFKILAAGAIHPNDAFRYAFESGADFICVGMYDFQIVEDSNIVNEVLASDFLNTRKRRWMA